MRVATSEEMVEMSLRTVEASRALMGAAEVRVEVRRMRTEAVNCISEIFMGLW